MGRYNRVPVKRSRLLILSPLRSNGVEERETPSYFDTNAIAFGSA